MKRAGVLLSMILMGIAVVISFQPVQADFGANSWRARFWDNRNFNGDPDRDITVSRIDFNWPGRPRVDNNDVLNQEDNFSVRFTSSQNFNADTYRFDIAVDDNVTVYIDGEQVFQDLTGGPVKLLSFTRAMSAGSHDLRVDFVEVTGAAVIQFQWFGLSTGGVPTSIFTAVPSATPIPPLTASVSASVRGLAVRTGPYLGATMVTVAIPGESFPVYARNQSEEGVTWYQINVNGQTGWSSGRYLTFNVEPGGIGTAGSVFDTLGDPPDTGVIAVPRSIMNMRAQPSTRTPIVGTIPWGAEVPLYNRTVQGGQNRWFQVRYEGRLGWIFAPYVGVRGNINAVPIR
jgi:uncharacterized protein YraI